jgi:hypothetical protein
MTCCSKHVNKPSGFTESSECFDEWNSYSNLKVVFYSEYEVSKCGVGEGWRRSVGPIM